jgi:hypothetical protein
MEPFGPGIHSCGRLPTQIAFEPVDRLLIRQPSCACSTITVASMRAGIIGRPRRESL